MVFGIYLGLVYCGPSELTPTRPLCSIHTQKPTVTVKTMFYEYLQKKITCGYLNYAGSERNDILLKEF